MASKSKLDDLDLSQDEIKRLEKAFKDEEFRKLFVEYAEEISDPENRKRYEEEIQMLENERGMNVEFINPEAGYVLKTSVGGEKKAFINICKNDKLGKPSSTKQTNSEGKRGLVWHIPHSFSPPREDMDKGKNTCMVYDVVFHPDTFRMTENPRFKQLVEDTALDGIERQFEVKLDRKNLKRPKMSYKGKPVATVIRTRNENAEQKHPNENDPLKGMPYPYDDKTSAEKANKGKKQEKTNVEKAKKVDNGYTTPKFSVIHRTNLELQEYTNAPDSKPTTRPKQLVVTVELPLLKSAAGVDLDIFEDRLVLKNEKPAYSLDTKLPYPVDDAQGSAKFDKSKKCLIITLPVVPGEIPQLPSFFDDKVKENGIKNQDVPPLIEELPPLENLDDADEVSPADDLPPLEDIEDDEELSHSSSKPTLTTKHQPAVAYSLPEFDYSQDSDTVTFVFHVRNVSFDSLVKMFPAVGDCSVTFASLGSGGFPMQYSFYVQFPEDCRIIPEHCTADISDKNLTLTLLKDKDCRELWNTFEAGLNEDSKEEKLFLTESSLQLQLDQLETDAMVQTDTVVADQPRVEVTEMSPKKLTINIRKSSEYSCRQEDFADDEYEECPSSADIQVVHDKALPNLHGILKQRSMSESSEDHYSCSSESPVGTSPRELEGMKKSVSFNAHIDSTSYKTNSSVTSMKTALKSKRRRNRKREEKKEKSRRRHNSGGSEGSSCDDMDMKSTGSSESYSEDEHEDLAQQISETSKKVADTGVIVEVSEEHEDLEEARPQEKSECHDSAADGNVDVNTSTIAGEEIVSQSKQSKLVEEVRSKLMKQPDGEKQDDSDDDDDLGEGYRTSKAEIVDVKCEDENAQKDVDRTNNPDCEERDNDLIQHEIQSDSKAADSGEDNPGALANGKAATSKSGAENSGDQSAITSNMKSGRENGKVAVSFEEKESDAVGINGENGEITGKNGEKGKISGKNGEKGKINGTNDEKGDGDGVKVETDLSWKENGRSEDRVENEHRTQCAFEFSNAVMFDLDVD